MASDAGERDVISANDGERDQDANRRSDALLWPAVQVVAVFAFLCLVGLTVGCKPSSASPTPGGYALSVKSIAAKAVADDSPRPVIEIATATPGSPDAAFKSTSISTAWVLLGLSLGVLAIFNLALYRHLRLVYSRQRRRQRRG